MTPPRAYLDHNASAPLRPAARAAMLASLDCFGNPSSVHLEGREARTIAAQARRAVASLLGADPRGVVFTSSATEAANLALSPALEIPGRKSAARILIGATEHSCVLSGHRFADAEIVPVDHDGVVDLRALAAAVRDTAGPVLLALQAANSETGVVQPVREAAGIVKAAGGALVCDAVQAVGRIPFSIAESGADAVVVSSHKLGGPKGAGALIFADPDTHIAVPLLRGGGQERGLRGGTEDVAAIAGFGAACAEVAASRAAEAQASLALRDDFERELAALVPSAQVFGRAAARLPNTSCFAVPAVKASTLLMALDLAGVAVSAGSACSSGKIGRSHVLDAMRVDPHMSDCAIRVSFGWTSRRADLAALTGSLKAALDRIVVADRAA